MGRKEKEKAALQEELGWECTCRARTLVMEMRGRGRGRGFRGGRGGTRGMLRNIKHQSHCKELERIRERGREMREKKQADWEERRRVRMEREKELGEKGGKEKIAGEGFSKGP